MIKAEGIHKYYGDHRALHDFNLEIEQGSVFGLLGPNGAGKTSFIRILNQITAPDKGNIQFKGESLKAKHIRQIGYLPEERGLYPKMKVGEQLIYLARLKGLAKKEAEEKVKAWLERFDLMDRAKKNVEELSKGLAQKVQFIASVIHEPELIILDEPFTGFDPINTEQIKQEILRLGANGATIIFSTHRMESVEELCEKIVMINKGEKVLDGKLSDIKKNHQSGHFVVRTEKPISASDGFSILEEKQQFGWHQYKLDAQTMAKKELFDRLYPLNIIAFEEEEALLHDIFIKIAGA